MSISFHEILSERTHKKAMNLKEKDTRALTIGTRLTSF